MDQLTIDKIFKDAKDACNHPESKYVFGAEISDLSQDPPITADCSEFGQWLMNKNGVEYPDGCKAQMALGVTLPEGQKEEPSLVAAFQVRSDGKPYHVGFFVRTQGDSRFFEFLNKKVGPLVSAHIPDRFTVFRDLTGLVAGQESIKAGTSSISDDTPASDEAPSIEEVGAKSGGGGLLLWLLILGVIVYFKGW